MLMSYILSEFFDLLRYFAALMFDSVETLLFHSVPCDMYHSVVNVWIHQHFEREKKCIHSVLLVGERSRWAAERRSGLYESEDQL